MFEGQFQDTRTILTVDHTINQKIELDIRFARIKTPAGFKTIKLLAHQATIVKAIMDLESVGKLTNVDCDYSIKRVSNGTIGTIISNSIVLSDPFGTGKTIEILALILSQPIPAARPQHVGKFLYTSTVRTYNFQTEILRKFPERQSLIRPNLIVVGSSVLVQWENAIKSFTDLHTLVIGDSNRLKIFEKLYNENKINHFDVILLKNGKISGTFAIDQGVESKSIRGMVTMMHNITRSKCWSRVIYDDFDTISVPTDTCTINALSSIYVSATTNNESCKKVSMPEYENVIEMLHDRSNPLLCNMVQDSMLFTNFNVSNQSDYVESSMQITKINAFKYVYSNPDDNYIRLMGCMGEEAKAVMEMLNGDAIGTAADALGIKSNSVADIFQRMLDNKYTAYMQDQAILDLIATLRKEINNLDEPEYRKQYTAQQIEDFRQCIIKSRHPDFKFYDNQLEELLDDLNAEYTIRKEQDGLAISRVIDNIKEGMCQVCALPLTDFDTFIVRCCGLIVCDVCGIKGNQIGMKYDYKTKANVLKGSCANCKADIDPRKDLIFVDQTFDLESILQARGDESGPADPEPVEPEPIVVSSEPEIKNPKLKAILAIVTGNVPENRTEFQLSVPQLLAGRVDIFPPAGQQKKVLIFANYGETVALIENFLAEHRIPYLHLGGTFQEKAQIIRKFRDFGSVLVINSQQNCAGMDIAFATDIVMFHKIINGAVESQVIGRGQRMGRTHNLRVHYLCYNNESAMV